MWFKIVPGCCSLKIIDSYYYLNSGFPIKLNCSFDSFRPLKLVLWNDSIEQNQDPVDLFCFIRPWIDQNQESFKELDFERLNGALILDKSQKHFYHYHYYYYYWYYLWVNVCILSAKLRASTLFLRGQTIPKERNKGWLFFILFEENMVSADR